MSRAFSTTLPWSADIDGFLMLHANIFAKDIFTFGKGEEPWAGAQTLITAEVSTPGLSEAFDILPAETWHEGSINSEIRWDMTLYGWGRNRVNLKAGRVYHVSGPFLGSPWKAVIGGEEHTVFSFKTKIQNMQWYVDFFFFIAGLM